MYLTNRAVEHQDRGRDLCATADPLRSGPQRTTSDLITWSVELIVLYRLSFRLAAVQ